MVLTTPRITGHLLTVLANNQEGLGTIFGRVQNTNYYFRRDGDNRSLMSLLQTVHHLFTLGRLKAQRGVIF
jgi:hypothetical protein